MVNTMASTMVGNPNLLLRLQFVHISFLVSSKVAEENRKPETFARLVLKLCMPYLLIHQA